MNVTRMTPKAETKKSEYSSVPKFVVTTMKEVVGWDRKKVLTHVGPANFYTSETTAESAAKNLARSFASRSDSAAYRVVYGELSGVLNVPQIEVTATNL